MKRRLALLALLLGFAALFATGCPDGKSPYQPLGDGLPPPLPPTPKPVIN